MAKKKSKKRKDLSSTFYLIAGLIGSLAGLFGAVASLKEEWYIGLGIFLLILILGLIALGYSFEI